jgi:hypothetical protein
MLELEAEEEEEDEQGLGDFGFTVNSVKKKDGESEKVVARDDDFENIVDDLSEDEGDEEAGNLKRLEAQTLEDQKRQQEVC